MFFTSTVFTKEKNINCNPCIVSKVLPMCCPHAHPSPLLEGEGEIVFRWP